MRFFVLKLTLLLLLALALAAPAPVAGATRTVDRARATTIKAAYLYHLASLTTWSDTVLVEPEESILIVILGADPHDLGGILAANTKDKKAAGHSLEVVCLPRVPLGGVTGTECRKILGRCQILFVTNEAEDNFRRISSCLDELPVLTVGETEEFVENGRGMVGFYIDEGRVRIKVSNRLALAAGVKLSAEFLQHALLVPADGSGSP